MSGSMGVSSTLALPFAACLVAIVAGNTAADRPPAQAAVGDTEVIPKSLDMTGRWVMTLPAGWQRKVSLTRASHDTWLFEGAPGLLFNGVYQLDLSSDRFWMIEADDPSQIAYEWQLLNANTLLLVREETPSGGSYVGATLARDFKWSRLEDGSSVEAVGGHAHGANRRRHDGKLGSADELEGPPQPEAD